WPLERCSLCLCVPVALLEPIEVSAHYGYGRRCDSWNSLRLAQRFGTGLRESLHHLPRKPWHAFEGERVRNAAPLGVLRPVYGLLLPQQVAFVLDGGFNRQHVQKVIGWDRLNRDITTGDESLEGQFWASQSLRRRNPR